MLNSNFGGHTHPISLFPVTCPLQTCPEIPLEIGGFGGFFFFFWLCPAGACRVLVPWREMESMPLALKAQSLKHWTTREVPRWDVIIELKWSLSPAKQSLSNCFFDQWGTGDSPSQVPIFMFVHLEYIFPTEIGQLFTMRSGMKNVMPHTTFESGVSHVWVPFLIQWDMAWDVSSFFRL